MKLAASNIAWNRDHDERVSRLLREYSFEGVEIAPTMYFPDPVRATKAEVAAVRRFWEQRGLQIVAMQALLFGHPELTIFDDPVMRMRTRDHLEAVIRIGEQLGAGPLVFGSPGNRRIGTKESAEVQMIACEFFHELGEIAVGCGTALCIEPNPAEYGCDFIRTAREGLALVRNVGSAGFCLHLDAAGMTMSGDAPGPELRGAMIEARHFHASEVQLAPLGSGTVAHDEFARELRTVGYRRWVSMEMRSLPDDGSFSKLEAALRTVRDAYGH